MNKNKRILPHWLNLKCDEVLCKEVPSLFSFALSEYLTSKKSVDVSFLLKRVPNVLLNVVYVGFCLSPKCIPWCYYSTDWHSHVEWSNDILSRIATSRTFESKIGYVYPFQQDTTCLKKDINNIVNVERRISCKRRLFE